MAEIKVNIKGDDSDLKNKFKESSEDARIFKESVTKSLDAIKAASQELVKETGLGGISKLLGAAGLGAAATEFTDKIVGGFKHAVTAALDFQGQVGKLRSALGVAFAGQAEEWAKRIQTISGVMGSFEENMAIFGKLSRTMVPEQAFKNLIDIQNAAKSLGVDLGELGEKFIEMRAEGEVPPRMFREMPALAVKVRQMLPPGPEIPGALPEESLAARVKAAGGADWLMRTVLPAIAPGGLEAPGRLGAQQSIRGQFMQVSEDFNRQWREIGQELLPLITQALRELKAEMPDIIHLFHQLGEDLKIIMPPLIKWLPFVLGGKAPEHPFGEPLKPISDYLETVQDNIIKFFAKPAEFLSEAAAEHKAAAENLHKALFPK